MIMNNDLISRDALIHDLEKIISDKPVSIFTDGIVRAINVIDNARPVDAYSFEQVKDLVDLNKKLSEERPTGEWIIVDDTEKFIAKCSVCGRIEDSRMVREYPFCHCGARMR